MKKSHRLTQDKHRRKKTFNQKLLRGARGPMAWGDLLEMAHLNSEFYPGSYALCPGRKLFKKSPPFIGWVRRTPAGGKNNER